MTEKSLLKNQSLSPEDWTEEKSSAVPETENAAPSAPEVMDERLHAALYAASEKKASRLTLLDLRDIASFTDYFIIASGTNLRQVQAIADGIVEDLKKHLKVRPQRVEGYTSAEWILLDYGDIVVHVFEEQARQFYDLERLWREARRVPLPPEIAGEPVIFTLRSDTHE